MLRPPIKHCKDCGATVVYRIPDDGDTKQRAVCPVCHAVHYENPRIVVGTVPHWGQRILLCKRKKDAIVEVTLPPDANIHAREYKLYLPSKEELKRKLLEWGEDQA